MSNTHSSSTSDGNGSSRGSDSPEDFEFFVESETTIENPRAIDPPPEPESPPAAGPVSTPAKIVPRQKRGPLFWLVVIVLIVAGSLWLANFTYRALVFEETDDAYISGHVHEVSSRLAGSVTEVLVKENEVVKAGQVLVRLDPLEFEIALQRAKAALAQEEAGAQQAQAAFAQAKAQDMQAQAQETSSEAQVQQIAAQLELAKVNFGRNQRLFQSDVRAISKADVDTTQSTAQATVAALAGAKADVIAAQARAQASEAAVESAQAEIASASAKVDAERAAVRDAERELSYVDIKAPSDGRIGNKNVEVGNRVQVGEALFAEVDKDCWITANFKETQLTKMYSGQSVEVTVDSIGSRLFTGEVDSLAPASGAQFALLPPDNATGNFTKVVQRVPVKIVFDPDSVRGFEDRLRPGLSTVVSVRIR
jgi:membrane fusion protein, multidrug efflux system